ncbi:MAG: hypothetical protein HC810_04705 [Acaryochloridaceae cyanobacterium RL_2_7]|nr:hypothetical protein [Acaryochloridaceae cyanobacterium RL_2_7]
MWARTHKAGEFTVHYGTTEAQLDQTSAPVQTTAEHDHTGSITLTGLKPGTMYHYQIYIGKVPSGPAGSFLTQPGIEEHREATYNPKGLFNFRFQFGSCANQNPKNGVGPSLPTLEINLEAQNSMNRDQQHQDGLNTQKQGLQGLKGMSILVKRLSSCEQQPIAQHMDQNKEH